MSRVMPATTDALSLELKSVQALVNQLNGKLNNVNKMFNANVADMIQDHCASLQLIKRSMAIMDVTQDGKVSDDMENTKKKFKEECSLHLTMLRKKYNPGEDGSNQQSRNDGKGGAESGTSGEGAADHAGEATDEQNKNTKVSKAAKRKAAKKKKKMEAIKNDAGSATQRQQQHACGKAREATYHLVDLSGKIAREIEVSGKGGDTQYLPEAWMMTKDSAEDGVDAHGNNDIHDQEYDKMPDKGDDTIQEKGDKNTQAHNTTNASKHEVGDGSMMHIGDDESVKEDTSAADSARVENSAEVLKNSLNVPMGSSFEGCEELGWLP